MPPVVAPPAPAPEPVEPAAADDPNAEKNWTTEDLKAALAKARNQAAGYRAKLRDAEPIVEKYNQQLEAEKTDIQRATERATQLEEDLAKSRTENALLRVAAKHGIPEEDWDLLGSGTPEELDARAARLAAKGFGAAKEPAPAPPSDRPLESLRPGASPTPPPAVDNSYPADWMPRART
jgi:hypothetical protein